MPATWSQVVVGFVRSANEQLQGGFDMWTAANRTWGSTTWKRSATAFMQVRGIEMWGARLILQGNWKTD